MGQQVLQVVVAGPLEAAAQKGLRERCRLGAALRLERRGSYSRRDVSAQKILQTPPDLHPQDLQQLPG